MDLYRRIKHVICWKIVNRNRLIILLCLSTDYRRTINQSIFGPTIPKGVPFCADSTLPLLRQCPLPGVELADMKDNSLSNYCFMCIK